MHVSSIPFQNSDTNAQYFRCYIKEFAALNPKKQGPMFLHGWSQGGYNTMAFIRKLESMDVDIAAVYTASAPADVYALAVRWIANPQPTDAIWLPACLSNLLFAMEYYDNVPGLAASAIQDKYYQTAKNFYNRSVDFPTFYQNTTSKVAELLKQEFMESGNLGNKVNFVPHRLDRKG